MGKKSFVLGFKKDSLINRGHFGDADMFRIYGIENGIVESRDEWIENGAKDEYETHGNGKKLNSIEQIINGVDFIIAYSVSPNLKKMAEKGRIIPVIVDSVDEKIIIRTVERNIEIINKFKENSESAGDADILKLIPEKI